MRQPRILLNLIVAVGVLQRLLHLLPFHCFGNLSVKYSVSAFG